MSIDSTRICTCPHKSQITMYKYMCVACSFLSSLSHCSKTKIFSEHITNTTYGKYFILHPPLDNSSVQLDPSKNIHVYSLAIDRRNKGVSLVSKLIFLF